MNSQQSPIYWSFSCGNWFRTDIRISWFLPILFLIICVRLGDVSLGLTLSAIFLASVALHEFGHIFAVRRTGGVGDEVLLWPLGGLAAVAPASSFRSRFLTPAGGPLVNLTICLAVLIPALGTAYRSALFYPFMVPVSSLSEALVPELLALTFWVNWILLLLNLIPVHPFDGGRMLQACLSALWQGAVATGVYIKIGCLVGFIGLLGGMLADSTFVVVISAFVLLMNLQESYQLRSGESYDDSFLGYDFSQGYTSLERDEEDRSVRRPGMLKRWRERRRSEKQRQLQERDAEVQQQLDAILDKIQADGMESLTDAERRQLDRASALYREKGNTSD